MNIKLISSTDEYLKKEIWKLLTIIDKEFIPPLSKRLCTTQKDFSQKIEDEKSGLKNYYSELLEQNTIAAYSEEKFIGFMSFIHAYSSEFLPDKYSYNYITTLGVFPEFRGQKAASKLYEFILYKLPSNFVCDCIATRTWSTNTSHINLLLKLGFNLVYTIPNERLTGVDTVYYMKKGGIL